MVEAVQFGEKVSLIGQPDPFQFPPQGGHIQEQRSGEIQGVGNKFFLDHQRNLVYVGDVLTSVDLLMKSLR